MSIDRPGAGLRHDDAAAADIGLAERSPHMLEAPDHAQMARQLTEKYGWDALPFARERAARAVAVGDELAFKAWHLVIEASEKLLREMAEL